MKRTQKFSRIFAVIFALLHTVAYAQTTNSVPEQGPSHSDSTNSPVNVGVTPPTNSVPTEALAPAPASIYARMPIGLFALREGSRFELWTTTIPPLKLGEAKTSENQAAVIFGPNKSLESFMSASKQKELESEVIQAGGTSKVASMAIKAWSKPVQIDMKPALKAATKFEIRLIAPSGALTARGTFTTGENSLQEVPMTYLPF
jgi:hypothetical protein